VVRGGRSLATSAFSIFGWSFAEAPWDSFVFAKHRGRATRFSLPQILDWTKSASQRQDRTRT